MLCICCTTNGVPRSGLKVRTPPPLVCQSAVFKKNTKKIWGGAVPSPVGRDTPSACPSACGTSTHNSKNLGMSLSTVQQIHSKSDQYASVCLSVCVCLHAHELHFQASVNFLCMLSMVVSLSSSACSVGCKDLAACIVSTFSNLEFTKLICASV